MGKRHGAHKKKNNSYQRKSKSPAVPQSKSEMVVEAPPPEDKLPQDEVSETSVLPTAVENEKTTISDGHVVLEVEQPAVVDANLEEKTVVEGEEEAKEEDVVDGKEELKEAQDEEKGPEEGEATEDETVVEENMDEKLDVEVKEVGHQRNRKNSDRSDFTSKSSNRGTTELEIKTKYTSERKDSEYNISNIIFQRAYAKKFVTVLAFLNPEFRYSEDVGPCESFDADGFETLVSKMKNAGISKPWPFDDSFECTPKESRQFCSELLAITKLCLRVACTEKGFEYRVEKLRNKSISSVWKDKIDALAELKTLKVMFEKMREAIKRNDAEIEEVQIWKEMENIFNVIVPAVESFDSKVLEANGISDVLATIHGRKANGFEISEEEVDKMLETSFQNDGFGDFPPTVLYAPTVFTTPKQLKLIYFNLERMSKVTDIRVKHAGIKAIVHLVEKISVKETMNLMEELKDTPKVPVEKMLGVNPLTFDVYRGNDPKRAIYMKIFFTAVGETNPTEDYKFSLEQLSVVLQCFYLIFSPFEINQILYKILSAKSDTNTSHILFSDSLLLISTLNQLPQHLKNLLEIGPDFSSGDVVDNKDSFYYQIVHEMGSTPKDRFLGNMRNFLRVTALISQTLSLERVMRMCMHFIDAGEHLTVAVPMLNLLIDSDFFNCRGMSHVFFEDLIVLALSKYSIPDKAKGKKYSFIENVMEIVEKYQTEAQVVIDENRVSEKWANMGHPWFSMLYLTKRFKVLGFFVPKIKQLPWRADDGWDGEKKKNEIGTYVTLAKVAMAWPEFTDFLMLQDLVKDHVPPQISRAELYIAMKQYAADLVMEDFYKKKLIRKIAERADFLTSHKTPEIKDKSSGEVFDFVVEEQITKSPVKVPGDTEKETLDEVRKEVEGSEDVDGEKKEEEEKKETTNDKDVVEEVETEERVSGEMISENSSKHVTSTEEEPVERIIEDIENEENQNPKKEETSEKEVESQKKPLTGLDPGLFYSFYSPDAWNKLEDKIKSEVYRQRKEKGYSNQL